MSVLFYYLDNKAHYTNLIIRKAKGVLWKALNYASALWWDVKIGTGCRFTGALNEDMMVQEYLNTNVFVCASSIENSSNSIGEAQILGVPCVCSYVGGTPSIVEDGKTGILYRFEEYEMLAQHIIEMFKNKEMATSIGNNARSVALERHNAKKNTRMTYEIYKQIINGIEK